MRKFLPGCIIIVLLVVSPCFAQVLPDLALKRGFGVRAAAMGGAYTAIADDGSAVFYNPAALAEPGFTYTYGNPDTEQRNTIGTFNFAKLGYLGYGNYSFKNAVSDEVSSTLIGFGSRSGWLSFGMNYKELGWTTSGTAKSGWSNDFGFLMRITPQFKVGLVAKDVLTSKDFLLPSSGRLGFGFKPLDGSLLIAGDVEMQNSSQTYGYLGLEANLTKGLSVRGGVDRGDSTAGFSLDFSAFSFDYAARISSNGQVTHCFETGIKVLPRKERPFSIIKPKEYALVEIGGSIKGGRSEYSLLGGMRPGLDSILSQVRRISQDSAIDGIMLKIRGFEGGLGGMAVVQEIRAELRRAREKGKKIIAYVEGGALGDEYYLAAFADKIVAPPGAAIGGFGKSIGIYRMKGLFEKLGIEWKIFSQGKYKNVFDPYSPEMSKEQEEMVKGLVSNLYRQMLLDISGDRKMKLEKVKEIGDGMIFTAREAEALGLIDEVGYYKDARKLAAEISGEEKKEADIIEPKQVEPEEVFLIGVFGVAVIEIDGEIVSGGGGENVIFGGRFVGSDTVSKYIRKASDDVFVKAVILRINSPGGDAVASGEIYKAVQYAREKNKIIIASIGNLGTSGGYYIASAADKIVASSSSITGSIGVIGHLPVYKKLLEKLDIKTEVVKEGKHADMFYGLRDLSDEEILAVEKLQAEVYDDFIQSVVSGRKISTEEVLAAAEGKIYTGEQALDLKLVDRLGGLGDAVDFAKQEAKIIGEPRLIFYHEPSFFFPFGEGISESLGIRDWFFPLAPDYSEVLRYN